MRHKRSKTNRAPLTKLIPISSRCNVTVKNVYRAAIKSHIGFTRDAISLRTQLEDQSNTCTRSSVCSSPLKITGRSSTHPTPVHLSAVIDALGQPVVHSSHGCPSLWLCFSDSFGSFDLASGFLSRIQFRFFNHNHSNAACHTLVMLYTLVNRVNAGNIKPLSSHL